MFSLYVFVKEHFIGPQMKATYRFSLWLLLEREQFLTLTKNIEHFM